MGLARSTPREEGRREEHTRPALLQELGALRYQPTLWSLQYEVMETSPEFNISNLFWDTEYCISVEPSVASRHSGTTRTDEQCVTIGHRDSECWGAREGGPSCVGHGSSSASWPSC